MTIEKYFENSNTKSDKIPRHGYQRFYPYLLDQFRLKEGVKLLEIGFYKGDSIDLWKSYFLNPRLYVIDIMDGIVHESLEMVFKVDQSNEQEIEKFVTNISHKFDIIVDDGSHIPIHQWQTFVRLFSLLEDGGVYIIEDIETSYWGKSELYGYHFDTNRFSIFTKLRCIVDVINREFIQDNLKEKYRLSDIEYDTLSQIEMFIIGHNCILFKKRNQQLYSHYYRKNEEYEWRSYINREADRNLLNRLRLITLGLLNKVRDLLYFKNLFKE